MRGVYTSAAKIAGLAASKTLLYITAPTHICVKVIGFSVTDESNATNFQMQIAIANITTLGTPSATANTPTPHEAGDQAASSTVKVNLTSEPTTYGTTIVQEGAAVVNGWYWPREANEDLEEIIVQGGNSIGFRMITTPTTFDCDVRLTFREIG